MPSKKSGSLMDVLIPMIISLFGMGGLRLLCGLLSDNSTMNNAMMIMTLANAGKFQALHHFTTIANKKDSIRLM